VFPTSPALLGLECAGVLTLPQCKGGRLVTSRSKGTVESPFSHAVKEMHETLYHFTSQG